MADYFDQLRPASFRGFDFDVSTDGVIQPRRIFTHKYPGKDEPYHEDMGLDVRSFSVDAEIYGDDFVERAKEFEEVLIKGGQGTLVHPYYGSLDVVLMSYSRRHNIERVGSITFSITFEKYGAPLYPRAAQNTSQGLLDGSGSMLDALKADFTNTFNVSNLPDFLSVDILERTESITQAFNELLELSEIVPFGIETLVDIGETVQNTFYDIVQQAETQFQFVIETGRGAFQNLISPLNLIEELFAVSTISLADPVAQSTTPNQSRRIQNAASLDLMFRGSAVASILSVARLVTYESREQALSYKARISEALDVIANDAAVQNWDQTYKAAKSLNAAIIKDISERVGRLPYTLKIKTAAPRASLALANQLYGDTPSDVVTQADDIVSRNTVRHPGFVGTDTLEVLINA